MAQTCKMHRTMYHTSPCPISAPYSTALFFSSLDGKQSFPHLHSPSSFYRSNDKVHQIRVHRVQSSNQFGRKPWSLEGKGSHAFMAGESAYLSKHAQRRDGRLVCLQALPRSGSFLPAAGPFRDFLFATIGAVFAFLFAGILARIWCLEERYFRATAAERGTAAMPETAANPGQKESVEWVNMVIHKIWKVYRRSLEVWLVQLLQPAIDNLGKPDYVKRVEIAELNLDYEPLIVRNVQCRASRRANDLQYQFGLRYAGGARCLLNLKLGRAGMETTIPVGVYDLDVDAELWLKLRLAPVKPYVGTLSLAFVRLPTIKLVLAPFRVVNLFSIPFLSNFLSKLLTVDLPRLLVLPRHITFDFLPQGQNVMDSVEAMEASLESGAMDESIASGVLDLLKTASTEPTPPQAEPSEAFVGELSVTVCDARDLPIRGFTGWSNPYCILALGDQVVESKRNKETSHPAGHKDPVWNQDFLFLLEDPRRQKLMLRVRDSTLTLNPNIGYCQISLAELKDCVPRTLWVNLKRDGPFGAKKVPGRVRLALTYKSYVDEDDEASGDEEGSFAPYIKVYGDSGAESVEEIGVSLGEEIAASLREERQSDGETAGQSTEDVHVVSRQRDDSSVEVTSSPLAASAKTAKPPHRQNGSGGQKGAASSGAHSNQKHSMDQSARGRRGDHAEKVSEQGNRPRGKLSTNGYAKQVTSDETHAPQSSGHQGHVQRPRRARGRPQEAGDASAGQFSATVTISSNSEGKNEAFHEEMEADLGLQDDSSPQASKTEGNPKLLWLCIFTIVAYIVGCSLHISNPLHP